jgi:hypothetical protein
MKTTEKAGDIPEELKTEIRAALDNLARGVRDREAAKKACAHMDQVREENRKLFGERDAAVQIIRESRERR